MVFKCPHGLARDYLASKFSERNTSYNLGPFFFFCLKNDGFFILTLLMTILTFTWRKNENNVQEIKEKYNVTAFTTN